MLTKTIKDSILYINVLILIFYIIIVVATLLEMNGILLNVTEPMSFLILWPFLLGHRYLSLIAQILVFLLPIIGIVINRRRYIFIHIALLVLVPLGLYLFYSTMQGFGV